MAYLAPSYTGERDVGKWLQKTRCGTPVMGVSTNLLGMKQVQRILTKAAVLISLVACFGLGGSRFGLGYSDISLAAGISPTARPPLTLKVLEQRLAEPVSKGGMRVVDLRNFTIDLRDGERTGRAGEPQRQTQMQTQKRQSAGTFSEQFYQRVQAALNGTQPLGLDLGNALIQGNLELSRLSLRVSRYGGPVLPALEAFTQKEMPAQANNGLGALLSPSLGVPAQAGPLTRSLLIKPRTVTAEAFFAFQGPLLLEQTCFNGTLGAANLYFLNRVEASGVIFTQQVDWQGARFVRSVDFSQGQFQQESSFRKTLFTARAKFNQASFNGLTNWESATFKETASFAQADFNGSDFSRSHWHANADFEQASFHGPSTFQKSRFDQSLFLTEAQFEAAANFRQAQFQSSIGLRGAHILSPLDFGDARFAKATTINVADLDFNPGAAKILGSPGY
ncbi:MAG: pentapeptide repeat-containing protein, partial [Cyanobacteria bacterium J06598_3]